MFKLFGFGRQKTPPEAVPSTRSEPANSALNTRQHTDMQREMVSVVLKDLLRTNGIPSVWMGCDVSAGSPRSRGADMQIRLVVRQWNEQLVLHLPIIQKLLVEGLDRFEPSVDHSAYKISWTMAADCGYPHSELPSPDSWLPTVGPTLAAGPDPQNAPVVAKPKFDLPPSEMDRMAQ
ncbi:MAG: hypothetical protein RLZZ126_2039, partial [Pseudomonadota bacterium]